MEPLRGKTVYMHRMERYAEMTDIELVALIQQEDRDAADCLVVRYKDRIFTVCYNFFYNTADAEDASQVVFIKVFKYLGSFRGDSKFSTWLYKIAINTCKNIYNSKEYRNRRKTGPLQKSPDPDSDDSERDVPDMKCNPATIIARNEKARFVRDVIDSLDGDKKQLMELRHLHDLAYNEIAEVLGVNLGTVKSRLSRIKTELWKRYKGKRLDEMH